MDSVLDININTVSVLVYYNNPIIRLTILQISHLGYFYGAFLALFKATAHFHELFLKEGRAVLSLVSVSIQMQVSEHSSSE